MAEIKDDWIPNAMPRPHTKERENVEFTLIHDGTRDTVVLCNGCGQEERFDSLALLPDDIVLSDLTGTLHRAYTTAERNTLRVESAMQQAHREHYCDQ